MFSGIHINRRVPYDTFSSSAVWGMVVPHRPLHL